MAGLRSEPPIMMGKGRQREVTQLKEGDKIWYDTGKRGAYGHVGRRTVPAVFSKYSASGKSARIRILDIVGKVVTLVYVKPTGIWPRERGLG